MTMKRFSLALAGLTLCLAAAAAQASPGTLSFAAKAEVEGKKVTLLDLVAEKGILSQEIKERLAGQTVMASPGLGKTSRVSGQRLKAILRQAKLPADLTVLLPQEVEVQRTANVLGIERIRQLYLEALQKRLNTRQAEIDVHGVTVDRPVILPSGEAKTDIRFLGNRLMGRVPAHLDVYVNGRKHAQASVSATVDLYAPVAVAARSLVRRHFIEPEDVKVARMNLADLQGDYTNVPDDVVGLRTVNHLMRGEVLFLNQLERAPIIQRGEVVTMICQGANLKIMAKGKAEQSGYKGGRIRLINLASKREVHGKVLDAGTVLVDF
jgi:flagella basal body P-ring formation protein FlgA